MSHALRKTIFGACRQLGLDDDARQALQLEVCGKASMTDMDEADMKRVLDRLKKDGFTSSSKGRWKHPLAPRADLRKAHKLWTELGKMGVLRDRSRKGLNSFVRTRFGDAWDMVPADIDMLREADKINAIVRALSDWLDRVQKQGGPAR